MEGEWTASAAGVVAAAGAADEEEEDEAAAAAVAGRESAEQAGKRKGWPWRCSQSNHNWNNLCLKFRE